MKTCGNCMESSPACNLCLSLHTKRMRITRNTKGCRKWSNAKEREWFRPLHKEKGAE